jgi:hypothetical protein
MADGIVLPLEEKIDWRSISIKISEKDVKSAEAFLTQYALDDGQDKERKLMEIRHSLTYHEPSIEGDFFYTFLEVLATRSRPKSFSGYRSY